MSGIFRTKVTNLTTGSTAVYDFPCQNISIGSPFGFMAGSQILGDINQSQWNCGSSGMIDTNGITGIGLFVRKVEADGLIKMDLQDLNKEGSKWKAPNYPKSIVSGLGLHYRQLSPTLIELEWEESGVITPIDKKQI